MSRDIRRIAVYGTGNMGRLLMQELDGKVEVAYFVVTNKKEEEFMEYPIYSCKEKFPEELKRPALLVLPGYDMEMIVKSVRGQFTKYISLDALFEEP